MAVKKGDQEIDGVLVARDIVIKRGKHGDILYKAAGKWKKLHIGALGEVLTVDADGFPSWAPGGGGGPGDLHFTGTYVGDGTPTQIIANVVPVNYKIVYIHILGRWIDAEEPNTHHVANFFKTDTMEEDDTAPTTWTKEVGGDVGGTADVQDADAITLNTPARGFTVFGLPNAPLPPMWNYMVLAKLIPT